MVGFEDGKVDTDMTAFAVVCGPTAAPGQLQSIAALGSSGQVLTSNGAGALPTMQASTGPGSTVTQATVVLNNSQVKNLVATPVSVVAAGAAGVTHVVLKAIWKMNFGSEVFTCDAGTLLVGYTDATAANAVEDSADGDDWITDGADSISTSRSQLNHPVATAVEAAALVVYKEVGGTEIAGNASNDGTISVFVWYIDVSM